MRSRPERQRKAASRLAESGDLRGALALLSSIHERRRVLEDWVAIGSLLAETGQTEAAVPVLKRALDLAPSHPVVMNNLAHALREQGRLFDAQLLFDRLREHEPAVAAYGLGVTLRQSGDLEASLRWLCDAGPLRLARIARADVEELLGRPHAAIRTLTSLVVDAPGLAQHRRLGLLLAAHGDPLLAAGFLRAALREAPDDPIAHHMLAAVTGESRQADPAYISALFDAFADDYDAHLSDVLQTRVPQLIADVLPDPGRVLDLGCGTGQTLAALPNLQSAHGVDLSDAMLDRARRTGLYAELSRGDILGFLRTTSHHYDTLLAADVFGYVADLQPVLTAAVGKARRFVFTTENGPAPWTLLRNGRFAHAPDHVRTLVSPWTVARADTVELRREGDHWVEGTLWVLTS